MTSSKLAQLIPVSLPSSRPRGPKGPWAVERQLRCDVKLTGDARRMADQLEHVLNIEHKGKPRVLLLEGKFAWLLTRLEDASGPGTFPGDLMTG